MKIYNKLRDILYKYLFILYDSEPVGKLNKGEYFSVDESLITHKNNMKVWLIVFINSSTKDFRIQATYVRDENTLSKFIKKYVQRGNYISSDGLSTYNFLDAPNSGYIHARHINGGGDFLLGVQSTSHIESIWNTIKGYIKQSYHIIQKKCSSFCKK